MSCWDLEEMGRATPPKPGVAGTPRGRYIDPQKHLQQDGRGEQMGHLSDLERFGLAPNCSIAENETSVAL